MKINKTALVLAGGGARGAYQIGIWQALRELNIDLDFVCGASVGSVNSAMIVQGDFELCVKLWETLHTEMIFDIAISEENNPFSINIAGLSPNEIMAYAKEILSKGGADASNLKGLLEKYINEDLIRSKAMTLGLTTVSLPLFELHELTINDIPKGQLIDFLMASMAIAPAVKPYLIENVHYIDGGYGDVMPIKMAMDFGCHRIIAVDLGSPGIKQKDFIDKASRKGQLKIITSYHNLGSILTFDTNNISKIIRLGYLDGMKSYNQLNGGYCTFRLNSFSPKMIKKADLAGEIFELDPTIIYDRNTFNNALEKRIIYILKKCPLHKGHNIFEIPSNLKEIFDEKLGEEITTIYLARAIKTSAPFKNFLTKRQLKKLFPREFMAAEYISALAVSELFV